MSDTKWRVRYEEVCIKSGIDRVEWIRVMRLFAYLERIVSMKEASRWCVRGRARLGWMDGVKVKFGGYVMTVEAARQC